MNWFKNIMIKVIIAMINPIVKGILSEIDSKTKKKIENKFIFYDHGVSPLPQNMERPVLSKGANSQLDPATLSEK